MTGSGQNGQGEGNVYDGSVKALIEEVIVTNESYSQKIKKMLRYFLFQVNFQPIIVVVMAVMVLEEVIPIVKLMVLVLKMEVHQ